MIRIVIADDHKMMRDGIKAMLQDDDKMEIIGEASNGKEALELILECLPDLIVLDINMPEMDGVEVCKAIKKDKIPVKILTLTMHDEVSLIANMIKNGASGFILKNAGKDKLIEAVTAIHQGQTYFSDQIKDTYFSSLIPGTKPGLIKGLPKLTRREKEIIALIIQEHTTTEIAQKLFISEKTVETHRQHLLQKFNVRNTAGLVRVAVEKGLVK
ncbi:MAG: response regulator [Candidatus Cyclobacteriaceae bacterium M3_2C_046]